MQNVIIIYNVVCELWMDSHSDYSSDPRVMQYNISMFSLSDTAHLENDDDKT